MHSVQELLKQRKQLREYKHTLDKDASLQTWEGMAYAKTLTKLVLIELELEEIKRTPASTLK